ncbi:MAG: anthranilate synthase component I family protein, partial [Pseudomonadota bacterium]
FDELEQIASKGQREEIASLSPFEIKDEVSADQYRRQVAEVIEHIRQGDIFQANISRKLSAEFDHAPQIAATLFTKLGAKGFAPYAAFLPLPGGAVLSNSPELFLKISHRNMMAEPIKGTRPRGQGREEDQALAAALAEDEKDRAENIMIADLMRNDLSKVCEDGSIREEAICALRTLPHIHHLYSRISGVLREDISPMRALLAAFPCGSVTGAPKHRAMQIIANQEAEGRGPYCGAIFLIRKDEAGHSQAVFSVPIRTGVLTYKDDHANLSVRAGGGVTILSHPSDEYQETIHKAYPFQAMAT